jgi:hypothetical protein
VMAKPIVTFSWGKHRCRLLFSRPRDGVRAPRASEIGLRRVRALLAKPLPGMHLEPVLRSADRHAAAGQVPSSHPTGRLSG